MNAQGEDVVAGIRTPKTISNLTQIMPEVFREFVDVASRLEQHYKDMQDIEFTIEKGRLFMFQTRSGKRTATVAMWLSTWSRRGRSTRKRRSCASSQA